MAQIRLRNIGLAFGPDKLLDNAELVIDSGDRIAILGRNGQGKSTLLKVIDGEIEPDEGEIVRSDGVRIARLQQEVPSGEDHRTVFEVAAHPASQNAPQKHCNNLKPTVTPRLNSKALTYGAPPPM